MTTLKLNTDQYTPQQNKIKRQKKLEDDKPKRKRITPEQFCLLSELFQQTDTPSHELREKLAKKLNMTNREVQVWFQNRRAKINRIRLQEQEEEQQQIQHSHHYHPYMNKKVKFNYYTTMTSAPSLPPPPPPLPSTTNSSSSSSDSSLASSPSLPHELMFHPDLAPIDILATAAAYVQQWDEDQQKKKQEQEPKKHKSWRPWL
ncbi:homeobox domain-containing protein [Gilbertella persicaria]|uniref:homeobox domain-containing protein n=1 Tax=Gilbertella persicaria TaxID=101096 RepID=UPI002220CD6E|nr:homeobox domain-containing protein [Gilbertella persicaria]KAI8091183.1 homeobox domain-containing protein [Gilbertella persicaria]